MSFFYRAVACKADADTLSSPRCPVLHERSKSSPTFLLRASYLRRSCCLRKICLKSWRSPSDKLFLGLVIGRVGPGRPTRGMGQALVGLGRRESKPEPECRAWARSASGLGLDPGLLPKYSEVSFNERWIIRKGKTTTRRLLQDTAWISQDCITQVMSLEDYRST